MVVTLLKGRGIRFYLFRPFAVVIITVFLLGSLDLKREKIP
jgi:hypothetical protein